MPLIPFIKAIRMAIKECVSQHHLCECGKPVTQIEAYVQDRSEVFVLPVLVLIMTQFRFVILGFHSDNGSEDINPTNG